MQSPYLLHNQNFLQVLCSLEYNILSLSCGKNLWGQSSLTKEVSYQDGWLYPLRAARLSQGERGFLVYDSNWSFALGYRANHLVIVRPRGNKRFSEFLRFCTLLNEKTSLSLVLKGCTAELVTFLRKTRFFKTRDEVNNKSVFEDEAYPEKLLNLPTVLTNPTKAWLRKINRFHKTSGISLECVDFHEYFKDYDQVQVLFSWKKEQSDAYGEIMKEIINSPDNSPFFLGKAFIHGDRVHGLYVAERLNEKCWGLYCAIGSRMTPGITEWMDYHFFNLIHKMGGQQLLLGGSENIGVSRYVSKLSPETPGFSTYPMYLPSNSRKG